MIYCSALYYNYNNIAGQIYLANDTTGNYTPLTLAPPPNVEFLRSSVEWIMEAPGKGEPQTSLPNFTALIFTDAFGCWKNNALGDTQNANTVTVQDRSLKALTPVKLESG